MKPINAEETVRVFNGWLEEADSLAEREAIERCIDHIQDTPAVSQQELRSYMLPWFSPFAAPWCGKIQRAFPKAYVTMNFELILVPRKNTYINLNHCSTPDEFKAEVIEGVSRFAFKAFTKPLCKEHTGKMKIFPSGKTGCSTTINTRRMGRNERKTSRNPALPVLRSESVPHCRKKGGRQYRNR